jgi:hypothetical protein
MERVPTELVPNILQYLTLREMDTLVVVSKEHRVSVMYSPAYHEKVHRFLGLMKHQVLYHEKNTNVWMRDCVSRKYESLVAYYKDLPADSLRPLLPCL